MKKDFLLAAIVSLLIGMAVTAVIVVCYNAAELFVTEMGLSNSTNPEDDGLELSENKVLNSEANADNARKTDSGFDKKNGSADKDAGSTSGNVDVVGWFSGLFDNLKTLLGINPNILVDGEVDKEIILPLPKRHFPPEYSDMGTSVLWAVEDVKVNPYSKLPPDSVAWGETEPKTFYTPSNYLYAIPDADGEFKCKYIGMRINATKYDLARVKNYKLWRMPTKEEVDELLRVSEFHPAKYKHDYALLKSRRTGKMITVRNGFYWTANACVGDSERAYCFQVDTLAKKIRLGKMLRYRAAYIRPVMDRKIVDKIERDKLRKSYGKYIDI
ncbi:hypothetical protein [Xylanibacter muris]|uniref:DUF1566 domain-containing protein n=1 Tax=Xylanibacter muris TaxID=2736290 RepID=A0ABX2AKX6_9BACT|nr:hypothetical protein [Xylanibacter muris]NPD91863.1 hypothetical protein [Xylanibacter muris]